MLDWLFAPIARFISFLDAQEKDEKMHAILRPYIGKDLWLAVSSDRTRVLFTALTPRKLEEKAKTLGVGASDFISFKAPKKQMKS